MTYYGVILLLAGYQADEEHIIRQYKGIMNKCVISLVVNFFSTYFRVSARYPKGTLWVLNKVSILSPLDGHSQPLVTR